MKIHVVAVPNPSVTDSAAGAAAATAEHEQRLTLLVADEGGEAQVRALLGSLESALARCDFLSTFLRFEIEPGTPTVVLAAAEAGGKGEPVRCHDLDGAGTRAALPQVLRGIAALRVASAAPEQGGDLSVLRVPVDGRERTAVVASCGPARYFPLDPARAGRVTLAAALRSIACGGAVAGRGNVGLNLRSPTSLAELTRVAEAMMGLLEVAEFFRVPLRLEAHELGAADPAKAAAPLVQAWLLGVVAEQSAAVGNVASPSDKLVLLGEGAADVGGSVFLEAVHGASAGPVPAVEPAAERRLQDVVLTLHSAGVVRAAQNVFAGGLLTAACELVLGGSVPVGVQLDLTSLGGGRADGLLFGEGQGRVILAVAPERVGTVLSEAHMRGVPAALIGEVTATPTVNVKTRSLATEWSAAELRAALFPSA